MKIKTYRDLLNTLKENPDILDKDIVVYQTDNWTRKVCSMQIGCGGTFLATTTKWEE